MSEKQDLIKKMQDMQDMFMKYEREHGVLAEEYFAAPEDHPLHSFRQEYRDMAMKVVELAHKEKGSHA